MRLASLQLRSFRNYTDETVQFSPQKNLLIGQNGQGKTNLLEALAILSQTKSPRTNQDRELIQMGHPFATETAHLTSDYGGESRLDIQWVLDTNTQRLKTIFKTNNQPVKSRSAFLGYLPSVSFFVSDLLLLRGTPEDRRRWLDTAVTQYDKRHLQYLSDYNRIRTQKAKLLRQALDSETLISPEHLAVWNEQLAAAGGRLLASRMAYLVQIQDRALLNHLALSGGTEGTLSIGYRSRSLERYGTGDYSMDTLTHSLTEHLTLRQPEELRRGTCLVGPHRDDLNFQLGDLDASAYGSQGQQRTIVLALKLSELQTLAGKCQQSPLLLLDDVMAELDQGRQRYLLEQITPDQQVVMTTTHLDSSWCDLFLEPDVEHHVLKVSEGHIQREGMRV